MMISICGERSGHLVILIRKVEISLLFCCAGSLKDSLGPKRQGHSNKIIWSVDCPIRMKRMSMISHIFIWTTQHMIPITFSVLVLLIHPVPHNCQ
uniref:Uncharacterized protein n=1 Tax=Anguilla anguilla TaxID=7936 RepID=A0A0E9U7J8_ANGAN